jgi:surfactin synthase thioesterase subunit
MNLEKYGQEKPPEIDLSLVEIPIAIYCAKHDILVNPDDSRWARDHLKSVIEFMEIGGGHSAFFIG